MEDGDPRIKQLQDLAWSLQSLTNKPGGRLPEAYKRECYQMASRAISLCSSAAYVEESDFVVRAAAFTKEIEAKKLEAKAVEEAEKQERSGKCLRPAPGGGGTYVVAPRAGTRAGSTTTEREEPSPEPSPAETRPALNSSSLDRSEVPKESHSAESAESAEAPTAPQSDEGHPAEICVVVPLPDGVFCEDVELDVSAEKFVIRTRTGKLVADQAWPRTVDPDSMQAAFSRRKRAITLSSRQRGPSH